MLAAKDELEKNGFNVFTMGLGEDSGQLTDANIILLPVPVTRDGVNINCALTGAVIPLDILKSLPQSARIFGGGKLDLNNYTDLLALDEYAIKNAVLTAEGAIAYALENTDFALFESKILVIGYGRVGKVLTSRLLGFYPDITVSARSERDFASLEAGGIRHIATGDLHRVSAPFDIVFNTVDIKFQSEVKAALSPTLFIDLSSRGEFEENGNDNQRVRYIKLPGIPAKTAYKTAGKIIAETVISLQR